MRRLSPVRPSPGGMKKGFSPALPGRGGRFFLFHRETAEIRKATGQPNRLVYQSKARWEGEGGV